MRITMEAATINHGGLQGGSEGCEERKAKGPEDRSIAAMRRAGWGWGAAERKRVMDGKSPEAILMGSKTEKYPVMKMPPVGLPVKRKIAFSPANDQTGFSIVCNILKPYPPPLQVRVKSENLQWKVKEKSSRRIKPQTQSSDRGKGKKNTPRL